MAIVCGIAVHTRCLNLTHLPCRERDEKDTIVDINQPLRKCLSATYLHEGAYGNTALSMFGRDLVEQVRFDAKGGNRLVPVIVEKCISAVEALGKAHLLSGTLSH